MDEAQLIDDSTKERLIAEHIGTVRRIAHKMARTLPRDVSVDDLIGAGLLGLADALAKHKGHSAVEFAAYLGYRVRRTFTDELRRCDPLTRFRRKLERRKDKAIRELTGRLGRSPRESEIAQQLGMPIAMLREHGARTSFQGFTAFDPVSGAGFGGRQYPDYTAEGADATVARSEQRQRLVAALPTLPERMQEVLRLYYEQECSLREIGAAMGVTESRACQLHRGAINRLRAACCPAVESDCDAQGREDRASGWV